MSCNIFWSYNQAVRTISTIKSAGAPKKKNKNHSKGKESDDVKIGIPPTTTTACDIRQTKSSVFVKHLAKCKAYIKSLSKKDRLKIRAYQLPTNGLYSHPEHIFTFNQLNEYLRGGIPDADYIDEENDDEDNEKQEELNEDFDKWSKDLLRLIRNAPAISKSVTLYRGVKREVGGLSFDLRPGDIITLDGFTSTSFSPANPMQYTNLKLVANPQWIAYRKKHFKKYGYNNFPFEIQQKLFKKYGTNLIPSTESPSCCLIEIHVPKGTPLLMPTFYEEQDEILLPHRSKLRFIEKTTCSQVYTSEPVLRLAEMTLYRFEWM